MISKTEPADFKKRFDIVGCYLLYEGRFVLLHRHEQKANGGKWGLPAGKVDSGESLKEAVIREVQEETGVQLSPDEVDFFDSFYVRDGDFDFGWHMFSANLAVRPDVRISSYEHQDFVWVTPEEAVTKELIHDLPKSIELFFNRP